MKKNIVTALILSSVSMAGSWASEQNFSDGFEFLPSAINTVDSVASISLLGDKVIFTRNDSTFSTEIDSSSLDLKGYEQLSDWVKKAKGQTTYDTTSHTLYFAADGKLYSATVNGDKVNSPKALIIDGVTNVRHDFEGSTIAARNWRYKERDTVMMYNPAIANGGKRIYFSAEMEGGMGGKDIWFIDKIGKSNKWSKPQNISRPGANDTSNEPSNGINSASNEDYPFLVNDSTLYFSSDRTAPLAGWNIYSAPIGNGAQATLLSEGINSNGDDKAVVKTNRSLYVLSNRDGMDKVFAPSLFIVSKSGEELIADANINEPTDAAELVAENVTKEDTKKEESAKQEPENATKVYTLFFEFNKDVMIENYDKEINEIKNIILNSPKSIFAIYGHTDQRGSHDYNQRLSEKRAKKIRNLLVEKGINPKQLRHVGWGSRKPIVANPLNDNDLQKNRRVEVMRIDK